jgi:HCOMODA/2-hydroxy-3-carboxy-muconic semialdehyde decarboxylase
VSRDTLKWLGAAILVCVSLGGSLAFAQPQVDAASPAIDPQIVDDLITANRILAHEGVVDGYGHVSIRDPRNPNRFLMARSLAPELVTAADIMEFDLDSNPIRANGQTPVLERFIHGGIYKARPDVKAVVHTHSPAVVSFSVSTVPLRPVFHMAAFLALGAPVWDPESTNDPAAKQLLVRNNALGASLASTLGSSHVALLRGHGAVIVGPDVRVAVKNAIYLETNARIQSAAIGLGGHITYISREEALAIGSAQGDLGRAWDYWKRRAFSSK